MRNSIKTLLQMVCLFLGGLGFAIAEQSLPDVHPNVKTILTQSSEPEGVVFEIETLDANALTLLAPYVSKQIRLIREAFPDVDVAVISHGAEEVALQKQAQSDYAALHDTFNQLTQSEGVSIHVCGAVGGLKGLTREDFPDFVSYSDSGLAQLNDYISLGYQVITIRRLSDPERQSLFDTPDKFMQR